MAITKRMRVSFDLKIVCPSKSEVEITEYLLEIAKRRMAGEKLTGLEGALLEASLESGPEGALEVCIKSGVATELRETLAEDTSLPMVASNIRFEVKR